MILNNYLRLAIVDVYTNRNIKGNNWFSSIDLGDEFRKSELTYMA